MMKFGKLWSMSCIAGVLGMGMAAQNAEAVIVTVNGSEVVFDSGGYEGETVGALPVSPLIGTYQTNNTTGVSISTGTSSNPDGPTGAANGSNYLSIDRTVAGATSSSWLTHQFSRAIDPFTESFTIEFDIWGNQLAWAASVGGDAADGTSGGTSEIQASFGYHNNLETMVSFSSAGSIPMPTAQGAWAAGEGAWNTFVYEWDANAFTATMFINGVSEEIVQQIDNPTTITQFHTRGNNSAAAFFIDGAGAGALEGDLDNDGFVGIADLNIILGEWNASPPTNPAADPSGDDFVGIEDLNVVLGNWNAGTPPSTAVPEPATLALFSIPAGLLVTRRRK